MVDASRLAMRLLHARHRDEPVRALPGGRRARSRREPVDDALAGNLCRCTGYRPIVDAALRRLRRPRRTTPLPRAARRAAPRCEALADDEDLFVGDEAALLRRAGQRGVARDALPASTPTRRWSPARPMSACGSPRHAALEPRSSGSAGSRGSTRSRTTPARSAIGATATHADAFGRSPRIDPDLGELMRRFGSAQVRASGTVGGNIANGSPIGDLAAGPDRARRDARTAPGRRRRARCRWRTSSSPTASRTASPASSCAASSCRSSRPDDACPRLQDLEALRRGHLGRDAGLPASPSTARRHRRRAHRLRRHGGRSRSAPPATEQALIGARSTSPTWRAALATRWRRTSSPSTTIAPRPPTDATVARNLVAQGAGRDRRRANLRHPHRRPPSPAMPRSEARYAVRPERGSRCARDGRSGDGPTSSGHPLSRIPSERIRRSGMTGGRRLPAPGRCHERARRRPRCATSASRCRMIPRGQARAGRGATTSTTSASPRARCTSRSAARRSRAGGSLVASISTPCAPRRASSPC